jgi:hypothetical protein
MVAIGLSVLRPEGKLNAPKTLAIAQVRRAILLALLVALAVAACGSYRLRTFAAVDLTAKTITVPPGGGLTGALKEALTREGWQIAVYRGPDVTQGTVGDRTRLESVKTFKTRYTLFLHWQEFDVCVPMFDPAYRYDLSVVDNMSGTEVMTLSGHGCEGRIVDKFVEALHSGAD